MTNNVYFDRDKCFKINSKKIWSFKNIFVILNFWKSLILKQITSEIQIMLYSTGSENENCNRI